MIKRRIWIKTVFAAIAASLAGCRRVIAGPPRYKEHGVRASFSLVDLANEPNSVLKTLADGLTRVLNSLDETKGDAQWQVAWVNRTDDSNPDGKHGTMLVSRRVPVPVET